MVLNVQNSDVPICCGVCGGISFHLEGCPTIRPRQRSVWVNICSDFFSEKEPPEVGLVTFHSTYAGACEEAARAAFSKTRCVARIKVVVTEGLYDDCK